MTAGQAQNEAAERAMQAGEVERADRDAHAERMQATIQGSEQDTSDANRKPDDGAVLDWPAA